jgi:DNA-binding FrmR family transcriptional regulator
MDQRTTPFPVLQTGCTPADAAVDPVRAEHQRAIAHRLKRAEGQIRGVLRMMEAGEPCENIVQQLAAARKALDRTFFEMIACMMESEVGNAEDPVERRERIAEITRLLARYA